jgi:hypothetical protein
MGVGLLRDEQDPVDLVDLDELNLDALVAGGGQVLADVVRADRKLAMTAVGENRQLDPGRAAVVEERVDRGSDRAAGVEDVVDEDARHPFEREGERRRADERLGVRGSLAAADVDVVAVEGDVELSERDLAAGDVCDAPAQPLCERDATGVDADERDPLELRVALDDLVRDPHDNALDRLGIEKDLFGGGTRRQRALKALLTV